MFVGPIALSGTFESLADAVSFWNHRMKDAEDLLVQMQASVNDAAFRLYGIDEPIVRLSRTDCLDYEFQRTTQPRPVTETIGAMAGSPLGIWPPAYCRML